MHISLATLVFTLFVFFEEEINKMDFDLTRSEWSLLMILWIIAIHANKKWFFKQWKKFRNAPFIFGIRNRLYKRKPLFSMQYLEQLAIQREKRESAQEKYDELYERAFGEKPS